MGDPVGRYLARYGQPEAHLASEVRGHWHHVVVVPMRDEASTAVDDLSGDLRADTLLIVVANEAQPRDGVCAALGGGGRPLWQMRRGEVDVVVVDRASTGRTLPPGEGVGLARRIGCDLAAALILQGRVDSGWIHTTDADVSLPAEYARAVPSDDADGGAPEHVGLTYPFWHDDAGDDLSAATALYELSLRYYVAGLRRAGSPYAVHTIGSTLALSASAYARGRGVPRRLAGEDFYLVNKLVKMGRVTTPACPPISIRPRASARAPFGTGPATARIRERMRRGLELEVYHPDGFEALAEVLAWFSTCAGDGTATWPRLSGLARGALEAVGARAGVDRCLCGGTSTASRLRRLHDWFDALVTLRFVHAVRDQALGTVPWQRGIEALGGPADSVRAARRWLYAEDVAPASVRRRRRRPRGA